MKLGLILLMGLMFVGLAGADSGPMTFRPGAGWTMDATTPGNGELNGGNLNNITYTNSTYHSATTFIGDIDFSSGYYVRNGTEGVINVGDYGATMDGSTDDTTAINAAIAAMTVGDCLYIPPGVANVSQVVFDPPDDCSLMCLGTIHGYTTSAGSTFVIGEQTGSEYRRRYNIYSLRVNSTRNWTDGRIGIEVINLVESNIDIRLVEGFDTGIMLNGTSSKGVCYNEFHLGLILNNQVGINFTNVDSGWANEDTFYGGWFSIQSGLDDYSDTYHVYVPVGASPTINNHRFYNPAFEGGNNTIVPMYIAADYVAVFWPRIENLANMTFAVTAAGGLVMGGRGVYATDSYPSHVVNLGTRNKIFGYESLIFDGGTSTHASAIFRNLGSDAYKAISVKNALGTVENVYITGTGKVYTTDKLYAEDGICVGNSAAGTTLGSVTKKIEVFNASGSSIGYIAVYDAIT